MWGSARTTDASRPCSDDEPAQRGRRPRTGRRGRDETRSIILRLCSGAWRAGGGGVQAQRPRCCRPHDRRRSRAAAGPPMTGQPAAGRDDGPGRRPRAAARRAGHRRDQRPGGTDRRRDGVAGRKPPDEAERARTRDRAGNRTRTPALHGVGGNRAAARRAAAPTCRPPPGAQRRRRGRPEEAGCRRGAWWGRKQRRGRTPSHLVSVRSVCARNRSENRAPPRAA